jgi:hypothetical protein
MATKPILIQIEAKDTATPKLKSVDNAVSTLGKNTKKSMNDIQTSTKQTAASFAELGSRFRYLSLVSTIVAVGATTMASSFVKSAAEMEQSYIKLSAYAKIYNSDFKTTNDVAQEFASTGLISVTESATTLANLLAMGLGLDKAKTLMQGMLDTAVTSKENLGDTFGGALIKSSQGMRIFQERQIDAVGINSQLNQVFTIYGKTINKHAKDLSNAERYQAIYNYYTKEFANFAGAASGAANTFSGTLNQLKNNTEQAKAALGNALVPLVGSLAESLNSATINLKNFVNEHPALSSAMISGTITVTGLIAAFAGIGAITPMVQAGFGMAVGGLKAMAAASLLTIGRFVLLAAAIGGVIYAILKVTGQWDKWSLAIKNVANNMANALNPIEKTGEKAVEVADNISKSFRNLQNNISLFLRDTKQDLGAWVRDHDKKIEEMTSDIEDLADEYEKSTKKIKDSFKDAMSDMSLSHARKTEDLQRDIEEERSKGVWADQSKIRDLERELKRENEDYALASEEKIDTKNEELDEEEEVYNKKLKKLKEKLQAEKKLEEDNAVAIAAIRKMGIDVLDEFELKMQSITDKTFAFNLELQDLGKEATGTGENGSLAMGSVETAAEKAAKKAELLKTNLANAKAEAELLASFGGSAGETLKTWLEELSDKAYTSYVNLKNNNFYLEEIIKNTTILGKLPEEWYEKIKSIAGIVLGTGWTEISNFGKAFFGPSPEGYAEGGVIPGTSSTAVPIIAHGGETVLPAGVQPINININNPSVRSDSDIYAIANQVKQVLSRQQVLKHYQ